MVEIEKEEVKVPTSRERLTDRYRKNRPDLNWEGEADNDIDALAADELETFDRERAERQDLDDKMNGLFDSNPNASKIFIGWANGKDPVENLIEIYGDDFVEALQSEEGKEKFQKALEAWRKGKEAEAEHQAAYDANIAESAKNLVAFADSHDLTDEQVNELVEKVHKIGTDVCDGLYTPEVLEMVYKAEGFEKAVDDAREEGRIEGKNEKIRRELRDNKPATGLPPTAGGQGMIGAEAVPERPAKGKLQMFGNIDVKRK